MKEKIKTIWDKVKKPFNWHVYPTTKDLRIKSFIEFGFYLFITAGLIYLFTIWHNMPERNIIFSVDKVRIDSCYQDSTISISAGVRLEIPMTNRNINYDGGLRTTLSLKKDSVKINEYHEPKHDTINIKSLSSDIYDTIKTTSLTENLYLADSLIKYIKPLDSNRTNSLIYFSLYYNRGPWGVRKPSKISYDPVLGVKKDTTTHSFRESHFHSKYFVTKVVYYFENDQSNLYCTSEGEVLGRPVWYRLEDISQSYYNIRFNSSSMDSLSLEIDFKGAVDFSNMIPKPDEVGMGNIKFFNQDKIRQIEMNGLRFHAKFRELENMQTIRLFAVTTILGGILIIFVGLLFVGIYYMGKIWKRHKFTVSFVLIILVLLILYYFNGLDYIYFTFISN